MADGNVKHVLNIENRNRLIMSGVEEIIVSDEKQVLLNTDLGKLKILGTKLSIGKLNIETGEFLLTGNIRLLEYKEGKGEGFFSIFK